MATPAQVLANRENSKHSTGPTSDAGKAISSLNHRSHGFCAADPVLPTEDRNEFNALAERLKSEWMPQTVTQEFLVGQIAGAQWKLARLERTHAGMLAALDDPAKAFSDKETAAGFTRLERYRAALERTLHRSIRELRASRKEQNEAKAAQQAEKKRQQTIDHIAAVQAARRKAALARSASEIQPAVQPAAPLHDHS